MIHIANPITGEEELEAIKRVLDSGMLAQGEEVYSFEDEFSDYLGVNHSKAVANGTSALDVALKSLEIGEGDEVITSPFSFIASSNCILFQDADPVFADIDKYTFNLDPESVKEKITDKTKAIIAVHLFGQPADMEALKEIAEEHDVKLVEDCAQAHGAEINGKKVGSIGDIGTFSFYPTKNMTTGEGGMVTTNDEDLANRADLIRDHGQSDKYDHARLGYNLRMTNIAAAIGRIQLKNLDKWNKIRNENAEKLTKEIKDIPGLTPPKVMDGVKHVYHQYVLRVEDEFPLDRDELVEELRDNGIGTAVHYPKPIVQQNYYKKMGFDDVDCPNAVDASKRVLSLPIHPSVSDEDLDHMIEVLKSF